VQDTTNNILFAVNVINISYANTVESDTIKKTQVNVKKFLFHKKIQFKTVNNILSANTVQNILCKDQSPQLKRHCE
jgi:hypothetical protein